MTTKISEPMIARMTVDLVGDLGRLAVCHMLPGELGREGREQTLLSLNVKIVSLDLLGVRDQIYAQIAKVDSNMHRYLLHATASHDAFHAKELANEMTGPVDNLDQAAELLKRFQ